MFIQALRECGLLCQPVWQHGQARMQWLFVPERPCPGVPVTFNGVWFNYYRLRHPETTRMGQVPAAVRQQVKAKVANLAETQFTGMVLTLVEVDNGRLQAVTQHGNVFGYVGKHHVEAAGRQQAWKVAWATAVDGNVNAILLPVDGDCGELAL